MPKSSPPKNKTDSLKTREQKFKEAMWDRMFVSRRMITSKAYLALKTATSCQVFMLFLTKCVPKQIAGKPKRKDGWFISNNGEIQFSYLEAEKKWGIPAGKFKRAIDDNLRVGLIDITKSGFGLQKDKTLYAISNRWEKFGTDEFVVKKRPKRNQRLGFAKGNSYGKNSK